MGSRMKKRILIALFGTVLVLVMALVLFMNTETWRSEEFRKKMGWYSYGHENHATYHQCDWNRDAIIEPAKQALAKARGLSVGTSVSLEDIIPFMTNSEYYFTTPGAPAGSLPPCPSGGKYSINRIGIDVVCSHPYHQWYNCMWKTERRLGRSAQQLD